MTTDNAFYRENDQWTSLLNKLLERQIPSFTDAKQEYADDCNGVINSSNLENVNVHNNSSSSQMPLTIQHLSPDTTSLMLSHLHPYELFNYSITCHEGNKAFHNELLWKYKFQHRWNCPDLDSMPSNRYVNGFWRYAYEAAYKNTHDLWVRHWNCVFPEDVTVSPGRTVIPNDSNDYLDAIEICEQDNLCRSYNAASFRLCPTCRYHPMLQKGRYNADIAQAVRDELEFVDAEETSSDPVQNAEIVAAAHSLLAHDQSASFGIDSTMSRSIHYSTMYSIAKWCRRMRLSDKNNDKSSMLQTVYDQMCNSKNNPTESQQAQMSVRQQAIHAFKCASTYNRHINTKQYHLSGLNFLTDTIFFNIHPSYEKDRSASESLRSKFGCSSTSRNKYGSYVLDELLRDLNQKTANDTSPYSLTQLGPNFETSHHSWHIIRLTNPDYVRPITFRAYIQCPKAFAVYPSQGYLKGGETVYIVLGVRMNGSLLNEAFEAVDVEREEADPSFVSLNAEKGHLPFVPFLIRYMFAPSLPCLPYGYSSRPNNETRTPFAPTRQMPIKSQSVVEHLWDNVTVESYVRTIPISCHVNSNYSLDEFQNATLMPFDLPRKKPLDCKAPSLPLTTVMPQVMVRDKQLFDAIQNIDKELEISHTGDSYRTEKICIHCKRDWGPQSEILGRSYILRRLDILRHTLIRSRQQADFLKVLQTIPLMLKSLLNDDGSHCAASSQPPMLQRLTRICEFLFFLQTDYLSQRKADRLMTRDEREFYLRSEMYLDDTYSDIQQCIQVIEPGNRWPKDSNTATWRERGIYAAPKCSDEDLTDKVAYNRHKFKPEPHHLQRRFGQMEQNVGGFDFGKQDDPNHESSELITQSMHTDMFHDDARKGLMSALAMIGKPESLMGHGIYDRCENPGTLIRCPSHPCKIFFRTFQQRREHTDLAGKALQLIKEWVSVRYDSTQRSRSNCSQMHWKDINFEMNDPDPDGLSIVAFAVKDFFVNFQTSMAHFICNIPLPGQGRLLLSSPTSKFVEGERDILSIYSYVDPYYNFVVPSCAVENCEDSGSETSETHMLASFQRPPNGGAEPELNIVWLIARHLGWTVDDDQNRGAVLVDRRILIAVQWFSNTIMTFSLLGSLLSRKFKLVKSLPVNLHFFEGLSVRIAYNDMRFWTSDECGFAALLVFGFYFVLGRLSERNVSRTYEREMRDRIVDRLPKSFGSIRKTLWYVSLWTQWIYDNSFPWILQKHLFIPRWNQRSQQEVLNNISFQRSIYFREHTSSFDACEVIGCTSLSNTTKLGFWSYTFCLIFALLSFSACSPHFVVNSLTVFCCSMAFGMSMSVESLENIRRTTSVGIFSIVKPRRLNTLVIGHILVGQLVGGSGGIIFLAEFVVTSICIILGGAVTITSRAVESWITFVCLSSVAFWGFVFARLGLLDAIRKRRRGIPSSLLCASLCSSFVMWIGVFTCVDWNSLTPGDLIMIQVHHVITEIKERWWND